ncbi:petrobactin biosynthesis protein AsbD [Paenibacillus validus]|uniref:Petrobactin biosynthesis protein AsbD n=1 Tax=Paenibacillus validus TaxID=44253 RepID=A0A7X2ZE90_9BACL|nr:petrobactin biosynthesis protein AsbD [Paenibacillus validus]MUG72710.1 petrobactin biosynthesis protein AsbD [Paenibacillus validus]
MRRNQRITELHSLMKTRLLLTDLSPLEETHRLNEDLHVDSVMMLQLLVWIEEEFGLRIPEEEVDPRVFHTVGSLLDFMERLAPAGTDEEQRA